MRRAHDGPSERDALARRDRLPMDPVVHTDRAHRIDREADGAHRPALGRLEGDAVARLDRGRHVDHDLAIADAHHAAEHDAVVVGLRARDVAAPLATAVHAAGVAAAVDLHQRLDLGGRRRRCLATRNTLEEAAIALRHRGDVLGLLLAPLDLEAADTGGRDLGQVIVRREVLGADQVAAVELERLVVVGEDVVLATALRARAAVGGALADHPAHVALAAVRDAERAVHERLETECGDRGADRPDVVERVLAREHDTLEAELLHDARARRVVHRHLRRAVDLEAGVGALDGAHEADVLHDGRVDAAGDALAEEVERVGHLGRLHQHVEGEVDAHAARVGGAAGDVEFVERELRPLVTRIEALGAEVDGVGPVGHGRPHGIERAGGRQEFGHPGGACGHAAIYQCPEPAPCSQATGRTAGRRMVVKRADAARRPSTVARPARRAMPRRNEASRTSRRSVSPATGGWRRRTRSIPTK